MKPKRLKAIVLWIVAMGCGPLLAQDTARLAEFKAYLFNSRTGALSGDVLAEGAPQLGNVPSGEFASISTLVVVRVKFAKNSPVPLSAKVRLVASEVDYMAKGKSEVLGSRIILDSSSSLGPVNPDGSTYVGFWLPSTGCRTINLNASLTGFKREISLAATLPFTCYE